MYLEMSVLFLGALSGAYTFQCLGVPRRGSPCLHVPRRERDYQRLKRMRLLRPYEVGSVTRTSTRTLHIPYCVAYTSSFPEKGSPGASRSWPLGVSANNAPTIRPQYMVEFTDTYIYEVSGLSLLCYAQNFSPSGAGRVACVWSI